MRKLLVSALLAFALVVPSFAEEAAPAAAPAAEPAVAAPATPVPAAEPAAAPAAAVAKVEGQIVVVKGAEGAPDTCTLKTADGELVLLPGEKLDAIKAIEGFEAKTFIIEGEKVPSKDGKAEGFMIKSFEEKK
ncbi:MAG: hypothetical protein HQM10_15740 [Candidatus Riflebacteria bacterium]|nr:hypothetical protein [Candidatus Riflebacteria bacterium]